MSANGAVTLSTIAKHVGLSRATVSVVLSGQGERQRIAPDTVRRVQEAARALEYVPNQLARSLRQRRTHVVGVLLPGFTDDWADRIVRGMRPVLEAAGYIDLITSHDFDADRERQRIESLVQRQVDAIVTVPLARDRDAYVDLLRRVHMPLVFLGDTIDGMEDEVSFVAWDSGRAAAAAVRHLLDTGRRRVGYLGPEHDTTMTRARRAAYERTLADAGLPARPRWQGTWPVGAHMDGPLARILALPAGERPDAFFCLNDSVAFNVLRRAPALGVAVPRDFALVGMGDLPLAGPEALGVSTMVEPCEAIGRAAAEVALSLIERPDGGAVRRMIDHVELKPRATTATTTVTPPEANRTD